MSSSVDKYNETQQKSHEVTNEKIDKIIEKFDNGYERYCRHPLTNVAIKALSNGGDPVIMLSMVLEDLEDMQNKLSQMQNSTGIKLCKLKDNEQV